MRELLIRVTSLRGRLMMITLLALGLALLVHWLVLRWTLSTPLAATSALAFTLLAAWWIAGAWTGPLIRRLRALANSVNGLADGDYAFSVAERGPVEFLELIQAHNRVGHVLREERQQLTQRELLLDTVIQTTPVAMALIDRRQRVIYANTSARRLLCGGRRMEGLTWPSIAEAQDPAAVESLRDMRDGLVEFPGEEGEAEIYLLHHKAFLLNTRPHQLIMLQRLTRELNRQEVATWKKVIRVVSHELNNSVAPISSLAHSGRTLAQRGDTERLMKILDSVSDRAHDLAQFIERYASFARLPEPDRKQHDWREFLEHVQTIQPFQLRGSIPKTTGSFDRTQLEQALINLVRNALEAGSDIKDIDVEVRKLAHGFVLEVRDRGSGMTATTLSQALVPFYSTKRRGSGIGLSLCREIVEAHDGRIALSNRLSGGLRVRIYLP